MTNGAMAIAPQQIESSETKDSQLLAQQQAKSLEAQIETAGLTIHESSEDSINGGRWFNA